MTAHPRPVVQRLLGSLELTVGDHVASTEATVDVLDFGGSDHVGVLQTAALRAPVALTGYAFAPRKLVGRPAKTERDIAVWLACRWIELQSTPKVAEQVVDLWKQQRFSGLSEPSHVHAARKRVEKAIGPPPGGVAFNEGGAAWLARGPLDGVLHTDAWVWNHGEEKAVFGILTARAK